MNYLAHIQAILKPEEHAFLQLRNYIEQFQGLGYGEGHMILACHAAFPVLLTPDLLYKLWLNFQQYTDENGQQQAIDRIAVSDLLHSGLVREVGQEVFEMQARVRSALLYVLEKRFPKPAEGSGRLEELARFMLQYLSSHYWKSDPLLDRTKEMQEFNALAYLKPGLAANKLRHAFSTAIQTQTRGEQYRIQTLVNRLENQYDQLNKKLDTSDKAAFETLVTYTQGMQDFSKGNYEAAIGTFTEKLPRLAKGTTGKNVATIHVPQLVHEALTRREEVEPQGRLVTILVAINDYQLGNKLQYCISDAEAVLAYLQERETEPLEYTLLFDAEATRDRIGSTIADILPTLEAQDQLLLYLCGTGVMAQPSDQLNGRTGFVCYDGARGSVRTKGGTESGALEGVFTDTDFRNILQSYNKNDAYITCIFDACNMGTSSWIDLGNPKQVLLTASRLSEMTIETPELKGGIFTDMLLEKVKEMEGELTYHELWEFLIFISISKEITHQQHPQLFGAPSALNRIFLGNHDDEESELRSSELWGEFAARFGSEKEDMVSFVKEHQPKNSQEIIKILKRKLLLDQEKGLSFLLALAPDRFGTLDELARIMSELELDFDIHEIQLNNR